MRLIPLKKLKVKCRLVFNEGVGEHDLDWRLEAISDQVLLFAESGTGDNGWDEDLPEKLARIELSLWISGRWKHYHLKDFALCHDEQGEIPWTLSFRFASSRDQDEFRTLLQMAETAA